MIIVKNKKTLVNSLLSHMVKYDVNYVEIRSIKLMKSYSVVDKSGDDVDLDFNENVEDVGQEFKKEMNLNKEENSGEIVFNQVPFSIKIQPQILGLLITVQKIYV